MDDDGIGTLVNKKNTGKVRIGVFFYAGKEINSML